eukprot:1991161-Pleurochrysis_carterae.AAC.9
MHRRKSSSMAKCIQARRARESVHGRTKVQTNTFAVQFVPRHLPGRTASRNSSFALSILPPRSRYEARAALCCRVCLRILR